MFCLGSAGRAIRMERLAKKTRVLLDTREKPKHRLAALDAALEGLPGEEDRRRYVGEHTDALALFAVDSFLQAAERLAGTPAPRAAAAAHPGPRQ